MKADSSAKLSTIVKKAILTTVSCFLSPSFALPQTLTNGDWTYTLNNSAVTINAYSGVGGSVEIPASLDGLPVTALSAGGPKRSIFGLANDSVTDVAIPITVTNIGQFAFQSCSGLTSIAIPSSVTSVGDWAFARCSNLTSITVDAANAYYSSLDGVLASKLGSTLIQFPGGLSGAYSIPSSVKTISRSAFYYSTKLIGLTIPSSVTSISTDAFDYCTALVVFVVDSGNPAYASTDGVLFNKAYSRLVRYPAGRQGLYVVPSSVTSIGERVFQSCGGLDSVTIPNSVTTIGTSAFSFCTNLVSLTIGNAVNTIGLTAFYGCAKLSSMTIPATVTDIGYNTFYDCESLASMLFKGSPPTALSSTLFNGTPPTIYYLDGAVGWGSSFFGVPTQIFRPEALSPYFSSNSVQFTWTNTGSIPMSVQRTASLNSEWTVVSLNIDTGTFTDTNPPTGQAFYRAVLP